MKNSFVIIFILLTAYSFKTDSFKSDQQRYPRVRQAYIDAEENILTLLESNSIEIAKLRIYIRAFKAEKKIELWAKNDADEKFVLIKEYKICRTSGNLGPKREQGDRQIPEGYYHINRFNPASNYYLSLGLNYPNHSDIILGTKGNLGGDIFIHGACVTIGCLPITDEKIKELYVFCVEATDNGQQTIPVTIFPIALSEENYSALIRKNTSDADKLGLWEDLKEGYKYFNKTKTMPGISFLENGRHRIY